ncbi:MAG: sigma-70 family RNA polymerase sigma factor, partial [Myxococcales bacterium]|nr:sigma-70 family RNA polymerase sigma factor [Myxococcales bacterium]
MVRRAPPDRRGDRRRRRAPCPTRAADGARRPGDPPAAHHRRPRCGRAAVVGHRRAARLLRTGRGPRAPHGLRRRRRRRDRGPRSRQRGREHGGDAALGLGGRGDRPRCRDRSVARRVRQRRGPRPPAPTGLPPRRGRPGPPHRSGQRDRARGPASRATVGFDDFPSVASEIAVPRDTKASTVESTSEFGADASPLAQIYREHVEFVWAVLRRLGVDEADVEDAAQDVFVVAHRRLGEFEGRAAVRTWLYSIALRVASNRRRKHARRDALLQRMPRAIPEDLEELAARGQARAILESLLDRLDE